MVDRTSSRFGIGALAMMAAILVIAGVMYYKARDSETGTSTDDSTRAEFGARRDGADR